MSNSQMRLLYGSEHAPARDDDARAPRHRAAEQRALDDGRGDVRVERGERVVEEDLRGNRNHVIQW